MCYNRCKERHRYRRVSTIQEGPDPSINCNSFTPVETIHDIPWCRHVPWPLLPSHRLWPWTTHCWLSWTGDPRMDPLRVVPNVGLIFRTLTVTHLNPFKLPRSPRFPRHSMPLSICHSHQHLAWIARQGDPKKVIRHCAWCYGMWSIPQKQCHAEHQ